MVVLNPGGGCRRDLTRWCGMGNKSDSRQLSTREGQNLADL
jgi:hypothetical protein